MALSTGQVLENRYRIDALIGQGGFGAVYRAWDTIQNRVIALKENLDTSPAAIDQFQQEAVVLASLQHHSLPRVFDHFILPGQGQYLVMDFVEGESLAAKMRASGGHLTEAEVLPWIQQVGDALVYLHSQIRPIIHRDIKPQNIIITPAGEAKLVDFGIFKVYDPDMKTRVGGQAVTAGFSPPEQYGNGSTDARSDIYALGATLYAALTGKAPPASVDRLAETATLAPPSQLGVAVSPATEKAILKAMDPHATQRFQTAQQLLQALSGRIEPATSAQTLPDTQAQKLPDTEPPPTARLARTVMGAAGGVKPTRTVAVAAVALVGLVAIVALATRLFAGKPSGQGDATATAQASSRQTNVVVALAGSGTPGSLTSVELSAQRSGTPGATTPAVQSGLVSAPGAGTPVPFGVELPVGQGTVVPPGPTPVAGSNILVTPADTAPAVATVGAGPAASTPVAPASAVPGRATPVPPTLAVTAPADVPALPTATLPAATDTPNPPTPTRVPPTNTPAVSAFATTVPSPSPLVGLNSTGRLLAGELFVSNSSNWPEGDDANQYASWGEHFFDGRYRLSVTAKRDNVMMTPAMVPELTAKDFLLTVDMTVVEATDWMNQRIFFRCQDDSVNNCYVADFTSDGQYSLGRTQNGTYSALAPYAQSSAIRTGVDATNTFAVVASGSSITLYANGVGLKNRRDTTYKTTGRVFLAVGVSKQGDSATVDVDNFFVTDPPGQAPSPAPKGSAVLNVAFFDRFDDNAANWEVGTSSGQYADSTYQIDNGALQISMAAKDSVVIWEPVPDVTLADLGAWVDTTFTSYKDGGYAAIYFRCQDDTIDECYVAKFATDGTYKVSQRQGGKETLIQDWTDSLAIKTGVGATNNFSVVANGREFKVFANDEALYDYTSADVTSAGGMRLGVGAYSAGEEVHMAFDNLLVVKISGN